MCVSLRLRCAQRVFVVDFKRYRLRLGEGMNLQLAEIGKEYIIRQIETDDEELNSFLFSLGCYKGEPVTVVSRRRGGCTVSIKDSRYSIDSQLAQAIVVYD